MPEEKADEMVADIVLCEHCDQPVANKNAHWIGDNPSSPMDEWRCQEPNWKERAKKAEAELTACYDEIFYTVPEAMPLIEKIKVMHGLEADVLIREARTAEKLAKVQAELDELKGVKPKTKEPKLEPIDPGLGDHMSWADFLQYVEGGDFNDDDGSADLATETHVSNISISCSGAASFEKPAWCSHVVWYNK